MSLLSFHCKKKDVENVNIEAYFCEVGMIFNNLSKRQLQKLKGD